MAAAADGSVKLERREQVAVVTLCRPRRRNAMNQEMWDGLDQALQQLRQDPGRAVILTGEGPAFCAGHDIRLENPLTATMFQGMQKGEGGPIRETLDQIKAILSALEDLPVPTIAAINGAAFGGGVEMALCCDLRVLDREATLCFVETRIGLMPDLGGTVRLVELVGRSHALDLICTARDVRAEEALALGLVNRLAPAGSSLEAALDLAALVAQNGPAAVRGVKRVVMSMQKREAHLRAETEEAVACILAGEAVEGITAWMQKRPPRFKPGK